MYIEINFENAPMLPNEVREYLSKKINTALMYHAEVIVNNGGYIEVVSEYGTEYSFNLKNIPEEWADDITDAIQQMNI